MGYSDPVSSASDFDDLLRPGPAQTTWRNLISGLEKIASSRSVRLEGCLKRCQLAVPFCRSPLGLICLFFYLAWMGSFPFSRCSGHGLSAPESLKNGMKTTASFGEHSTWSSTFQISNPWPSAATAALEWAGRSKWIIPGILENGVTKLDLGGAIGSVRAQRHFRRRMRRY